MLHFFRKIRRDLLANSQFFKYLKYAIGEIVLVVLGILIALYINNQNEQKKEQERINQVLVEVEKELETNISVARYYIYDFAIEDSLFLKVLIDSVDTEDYKGQQGYRLRTLAYTYGFAPIKDDSFKKLNQYNNLTLEQEQLVDDLNDINNTLIRLEEAKAYMLEGHKKNLTTIKKYDWFKNMVFGVEEETINDYYLYNPEHLSSSAEYFILVSDYSRFLRIYDKKAVSVYRKIYDYLDGHEIRHSDSLLFQHDYKAYKHYIGKYESKWSSKNWYVPDDSISISIEEGKLLYTGYRSEEPNILREITPIDKYHFRTNGGFYHLEFDDHGEVEGIRFSAGPGLVLDMKKVR
ncbi:hypothetical protein [Lutimonas zeaxanthinifaciens]|uniref:hypothetical protein n=1 Tax=Lutimonas zeaxanthinifaciens TaxID=3060215 RepID=UPI00265D293F|nr:hypothetical protein [Lutimonas sp. YSD2104]WKK66498.1 hypothetical protein QZH61_02485 [Lutimonas sp. YSD2104]